jgi:alkylation response protein AidB-like acyl-CoA dehydrogenase
MQKSFFNRDIRDYQFILFEQLDMNRLLGYQDFADFSVDDFNMILEEARKVSAEVLGPELQESDRTGAKYEGGKVTLPECMHRCWNVLKENGWISTSNNPEYGGQGLPTVLGILVSEMFCGANNQIVGYPGLAVGAGRLIENYGTDEDKALFCENMYTGVWGGTMCLTEPDAGTDNGYLRTKAIPDPDSGDPRVYKIEGSKCFISAGDHDLTDNIIHLLIARIEGAPMGTKGISLFIVPKVWVNSDGSLGEPNDVSCGGIEHKMGIHSYATCTLNFGENGGCRGILLGQPNSGMAKMFQMMNEARIGTGIGAVGVASAAYDVARAYAKERVQGPPFQDRSAPRVRIIEHEDVRRMLLNQKAGTEAMRAFAGHLAYLLDVVEHDPDQAAREKAHKEVDLLTPLVKSYCSDFAFELTRDAMQVLGGVGYTKEFPVEQLMRDCKITSIYEGINYIQSLDLVGRKLLRDGGQAFGAFMQDLSAFIEENQADPEFAGDFEVLGQAVKMTVDFAQTYGAQFGQGGNIHLIPLTSVNFLNSFAETVLARSSLQQAMIARDKLKAIDPESSDGFFYRGKVQNAHFFCRNTLTNVFARHKSLTLKDTSPLDIPEESF